MRYVIIGNGIAAVSAVDAIRENDKKGKITVISEEPYQNYSRPLISYLLSGKIGRGRMSFRGKDFYKRRGVRLLLSRKAKRLDLKKKAVVLSAGKRIFFDRLLIAAGSRPLTPDIKGSGAEGVFTFAGLADAERLKKHIGAARPVRAVIVGGGLIGIKAAEALIQSNIRITIVELADRILPSGFDAKSSDIIGKALKKAGCELITGNAVTEIRSAGGRVKEVVLKDGKKIFTGIVVVAAGVRPNTELAKNTPIKTGEGIRVDDFMRTNVNGVYAAGDCCEAKDRLLGVKRTIPVWPVAASQGRCAGSNMSGRKIPYRGGIAMNSVELCGIPAVSVGIICPGVKAHPALEYFKPEKNIYKKIFLKQGKIVGAVFVGDIERAGIYTGLIRDGIDVADFKDGLLKKDFGLIYLPGTYRKHLVSGEAAII